MKLCHAVSGAAFAAALLIGFGNTSIPAHACTVSNVMNLKDRCPPGLTLAAAPTRTPVMAGAADDQPTVTPVSYSTMTPGCVRTNVINLKNACPRG